jgi:hypothetical protein
MSGKRERISNGLPGKRSFELSSERKMGVCGPRQKPHLVRSTASIKDWGMGRRSLTHSRNYKYLFE